MTKNEKLLTNIINDQDEQIAHLQKQLEANQVAFSVLKMIFGKSDLIESTANEIDRGLKKRKAK